jgi:cyclase
MNIRRLTRSAGPVVLVLASFAPLPAQDLQRVEIAAGIYQFLAPYDGYVYSTSTAIVDGAGVLVYDTNTRPSIARAVLAGIRKITDKPVRFVVNSHSHPDHWSGNEVYADAFPDLAIISTDDALRIMKAVAPVWPASFSGDLRRAQAAFDERMRSGKNTDGSEFTAAQRKEAELDLRRDGSLVDELVKVRRTYPNLTFHDRLTLFLGGRELRFMNCFGDATGEAVLYLPQEKLLLTGDMLVYPRPYVPNGYRIAPWLESLKDIARLDVDTFIPGHGPALHGKTYLNLVIELIETVTARVRTLLEQGAVTVEEVQAAVKLDTLRAKFGLLDRDPNFDRTFQAAMDRLVKRIYDESRDGREFTR